jgi:hypothetical protein
MVSTARLVLLCGILLTGCHTVKRAAVTTFRVIDTPARYVRERIDQPATTTTTTTQYATSDVVYPGRPVNATPPASGRPQAVAPPVRDTSPPPGPRSIARNETTSSAPPSPAPRATPRPTAAPPASDFPTAKPVPGKPGYVYSIDPNGGIVDVTGYKSGDKAKDPYTKQIFIVP